MRVYYLFPSAHAAENIRKQRIKVARIHDLNDPFELIGANRSDRRSRPALREFRDEIHRTTGIICFSRTWQNPVMWGHYGDKHQGVCFDFEIPQRKLKEVAYVKELVDIDAELPEVQPRIDYITKRRLLRTKFYDWRYEREWRLIVKLDRCEKEKGLFFVPFSEELVLRRVILGPRCTLTLREIRRLVSGWVPQVKVVKARLAFRSFRVVRHVSATNRRG